MMNASRLFDRRTKAFTQSQMVPNELVFQPTSVGLVFVAGGFEPLAAKTDLMFSTKIRIMSE